MKRYALFVGQDYYPQGGWGDFSESYDDYEAATQKAVAESGDCAWAHVVDLQTGKVVFFC